MTKEESNQNSLHSWDEPQTISCSLKMEWKPLGKVELDEDNRLVLPDVDTVSALYRFRIRQSEKESVYIGETENIKRRFGQYKNPSASQRTNLRINNALVTALQAGAEVSVSVIINGTKIDIGDGLKPMDLSSKVARCYFESAALLHNDTNDMRRLNKQH